MKIPETPSTVEQLDLMKRLEDYAEGRATWLPNGDPLGTSSRKACRHLHTQIVRIIDQVFASILDRVTARELDTFTMHDRKHGLKVAHLMWHILSEERRALITPPEIGVMVLSAHLHDAGMALSKEERVARLDPGSDLWQFAEIDDVVKRNLERLRLALQDTSIAVPKRRRIEAELFQAEEALLAMDTRNRHASRERYIELIAEITDYHDKDRARIPDIQECFSFDGDSFMEKLIEVCVSHNQDADSLVEQDKENFDRPRFPRDYPVGSATVDLQLAAAALRLADILDFDRERTPAVLFHYLVPSSLRLGDEISTLEWSKHLAISNWEIDGETIVFRGRSKSHIVHHAVIRFCEAIEEEISTTKATFGTATANSWPFALPTIVRADIHAEGYRYVPYRFELDEKRVYELLMGGAIYENPLVAIRELIQNAVDACSYRDALSKLHEPHLQPDRLNRISVRYEEAAQPNEFPILTVSDTGTGMDAWVIERWFLKVGRSYYSSNDFARDRLELRKRNVDFAPVSEFGIGFLSSFLLADRVEVETAMWEPVRGDTRKRHLEIDGPTRLIRIRETPNEGVKRFKGTSVRLHLSRGGKGSSKESRPEPPSWDEILSYLRETCRALPYRLTVERVSDGKVSASALDAMPLLVEVPPPFSDRVIRIPISSDALGIVGEVAFVPESYTKELEKKMMEESPISMRDAREDRTHSYLLRGGFNVGPVPGARSVMRGISSAVVNLKWQSNLNFRYLPTNLGRTGIIEDNAVASSVSQMWIGYLIEHRNELPPGSLDGLDVGETWLRRSPRFRWESQVWLDKYNLFELYELARLGWQSLFDSDNNHLLTDWESQGDFTILCPTDMHLFGKILNRTLPRIVANRRMNSNGHFYVASPDKEWRNVLKSSTGFASNPARWPKTAIYTGAISQVLYSDWGGRGNPLNERYSERLGGFDSEELTRLPDLFSRLMSDRHYERPTALGTSEAELLEKAVAAIGDLQIRSVYGSYRLDTFFPKIF
jgi:hypothetical protein